MLVVRGAVRLMKSDKSFKIPFQSVDLIKELDKLFPEKVPDKEWSDREIWIYVGKRELINWLKAKLEQEERE